MSGVIVGFGVIASIVAVGYILGRLDVLGRNGREVLSRLSFYVATPALLFDILSTADLSVLVSAPLLVSALSMLVVAALFVAVGLLRRWGVARTTMGALCASYVNAGNLGIPISAYVLGDASLVAPVLLFQLLVLGPIGLTVLDVNRSEPGGRTGPLRILTTPLRNPVVIGCLAGVAVAASGWSPPEPFMEPFELVGSISVPAVLLAFGISLHGSPLPFRGPEKAAVGLAVLLKCLVQPAAAWAVGVFAFGLSGAELFAVVVLAALPTAQNMYTYSLRYGAAETMTREIVLLSTLLTLPVLVGIAFLLG
ncbi:AEC family transporter [Streptomonospora nanhaiensis]|uniref:AEC family transporter n=1 Tax=Streptomonospora nanhaiensis TaxID=1323731 RepID=UPI0015CBBFB6|nr:AEC family transporter [Streptomonospora nanhaiensis]MBV2364017.1 AEC family transporter [Streptomonospora nanhaiensis]MBX9387361.1 AEC family transporter [Streptomonospora nanhaiensis]